MEPNIVWSEFVKNHTEREIIAWLTTELRSISNAMSIDVKEEEMYDLCLNVNALGNLVKVMELLNEKTNGAKKQRIIV